MAQVGHYSTVELRNVAARGKPRVWHYAPPFSYDVKRLADDLQARVAQLQPPYDMTFTLTDGDVNVLVRVVHTGIYYPAWSVEGAAFITNDCGSRWGDIVCQLDAALKGITFKSWLEQ